MLMCLGFVQRTSSEPLNFSPFTTKLSVGARLGEPRWCVESLDVNLHSWGHSESQTLCAFTSLLNCLSCGYQTQYVCTYHQMEFMLLSRSRSKDSFFFLKQLSPVSSESLAKLCKVVNRYHTHWPLMSQWGQGHWVPNFKACLSIVCLF